MTSNASPSSSSDVDEEESDYPPLSKKSRSNPPHDETIPNSNISSIYCSRFSDTTPTLSSSTLPGPSISSQCLDMSTNSNSSLGCHDEPSSSQATECGPGVDNGDLGDTAPLLASLQARLREREVELTQQRREAESFLKELQESVECPVCFSIPRAPPVPCCQNGHVICSKCKDKVEVCPTCRVAMTNCVSQVAATIIQKIQHPCDFRDAGCDTRCDIQSISAHEESCGFRLVRCPHWACDEQISLTSLTSHVISAECGDNYMAKPLPYQEEIEYTRALDDQDGNSFWRPSLLQFQNVTFYLQVEKQDKQWYFYVQMEGSSSECEKFESRVSVCKYANSDRHSISYFGKVCPIDIKGADELDAAGCGLNVRDAVMEKIFVVDTSTCDGEGIGKGTTSSAVTMEKEEGEVGEGGEEGDGDRYKFWVKVDLSKATD